MATTLDEAIQTLYRHEINVSVSSFWDCGWRVRIGDELNGFSAERQFGPDQFDAIADWLLDRLGNRGAVPAPEAADAPAQIQSFAHALGIARDKP